MKHFTPINNVALKDSDQSFDLDTLDILEDGCHNDEYTYTMRFSVDDLERRDAIRRRLESEAEHDAPALLAVLDENDWDVSFYVDCW